MCVVANQTARPANIIPPTLNVPPPVPEASPVLYTLVASPHLKVRIQEPMKETVEIPQQPSSNLYTVIGNPHLPASIPVSTTAPPAPVKQSSPILYSIVANPKLTSNLTYTNTPNQPRATQPIQSSSVPTAPILYTIVGETQVPNNILKANRVPLAPIKRQANENALYGTIGDPTVPQSTTLPRKTQPLPPTKQLQQLPPISTPMFYSIVGQPSTSPERK